MPNAFVKNGFKPIYVPRRDMKWRVLEWFRECHADTDLIASITGYKESSVHNWLHAYEVELRRKRLARKAKR